VAQILRSRREPQSEPRSALAIFAAPPQPPPQLPPHSWWPRFCYFLGSRTRFKLNTGGKLPTADKRHFSGQLDRDRKEFRPESWGDFSFQFSAVFYKM